MSFLRHAHSLLSLCALLVVPSLYASADTHSTEETLINQVLVLTNRIRMMNGAPPLKIQENLQKAAHWQAQDMADQKAISHTDHTGRAYDARIADNGYDNYMELGENLAAGQISAEEVVNEWMQSPGHRANLLNPGYNEIGIGYVYRKDSPYLHFWVQDFGTRRESYPVIINAGETETTHAQVHLYLHGSEGMKEMRLSNDGMTWTDWQPYQSRIDWQLTSGNGKHTVFAEVRDDKKIYRSTDTITVVPARPGPSASSRKSDHPPSNAS